MLTALRKLIVAQKSPRIRALWAALARGQSKDRRFARLAASYVGLRQDLIEAGTEFQVARHGEDPRFEGSPVRVASNILRDRTSDVLQPAELATTSCISMPGNVGTKLSGRHVGRP